MPEQTEFPDDLVSYLLEKWSSRTLLKTPEDSLSFDEYFRKSWSISTKLASKRGQPVVILSRDRQFVLIAFWAIWISPFVLVVRIASVQEGSVSYTTLSTQYLVVKSMTVNSH